MMVWLLLDHSVVVANTVSHKCSGRTFFGLFVSVFCLFQLECLSFSDLTLLVFLFKRVAGNGTCGVGGAEMVFPSG
jgi:hypothetical protein